MEQVNEQYWVEIFQDLLGSFRGFWSLLGLLRSYMVFKGFQCHQTQSIESLGQKLTNISGQKSAKTLQAVPTAEWFQTSSLSPTHPGRKPSTTQLPEPNLRPFRYNRFRTPPHHPGHKRLSLKFCFHTSPLHKTKYVQKLVLQQSFQAAKSVLNLKPIDPLQIPMQYFRYLEFGHPLVIDISDQ